MRRWGWVALAIAGCALLAAYVAAYRRHRTGLEILQTSLDAFDFGMLLSRQPVLVAEPLPRLDDVVAAWFGRWNTVGATAAPPTPRLHNGSKYLLVHAAGGAKTAVELTNPAHPDAALRVMVPPHALLIAPFMWDVAFPEASGVTVTPVDDWITLLNRAFYLPFR